MKALHAALAALLMATLLGCATTRALDGDRRVPRRATQDATAETVVPSSPKAQTPSPPAPRLLAVIEAPRPADLDELGGEPFSLEAGDASLQEILAVLSRACGRTLRAAPGIGARISVRWREVTAGEALERLTHRLNLIARPGDDRIVLDRRPPMTALLAIPERPGERVRVLELIRDELTRAGELVLAGRGLVLVSDRPGVITRIAARINAAHRSDNDGPGGRSWTTRGSADEALPKRKSHASPSM